MKPSHSHQASQPFHIVRVCKEARPCRSLNSVWAVAIRKSKLQGCRGGCDQEPKRSLSVMPMASHWKQNPKSHWGSLTPDCLEHGTHVVVIVDLPAVIEVDDRVAADLLQSTQEPHVGLTVKPSIERALFGNQGLPACTSACRCWSRSVGSGR